MTALVIGIPVCIVFSFGLAEWSDRSGRLPFQWAFLFGLTLSPVVSLFIILVSKNYNKEKLSHFMVMLLLLTFFTCAGAVLIILYRLMQVNIEEWFFYILPVTGLTILCIYIIHRLRINTAAGEEDP